MKKDGMDNSPKEEKFINGTEETLSSSAFSKKYRKGSDSLITNKKELKTSSEVIQKPKKTGSTDLKHKVDKPKEEKVKKSLQSDESKKGRSPMKSFKKTTKSKKRNSIEIMPHSKSNENPIVVLSRNRSRSLDHEYAPVLKEEKSKEAIDKSRFTWAALPEKVQKTVSEYGFDHSLIEKNAYEVWVASYFLLRKEFPLDGTLRPQAKNSKGTRTSLTEEDFQIEQKKLILLDKQNNPKFGKMLECGVGGFAKVYYTKIKIDNKLERIAVKKVKVGNDKHFNDCLTELYFLNHSSHKNIVTTHKAYLVNPGNKDYKVAEKEVWILMEYMEGGTLKLAAETGTLLRNHIGYCAREILLGLEFLHSKNYAHRDLKSYNVMLSITGEVKIIDFGLALNLNVCKNPTQLCGSPYWVPPEMVRQDIYGTEVDIWSLGVCILELFLNKPPHLEKGPLYSLISTCVSDSPIGFKDLFPVKEPPKVIEFLQGCLQRDPKQRMTASQLLKLSWFDDPNLGNGITFILKNIFGLKADATFK